MADQTRAIAIHPQPSAMIEVVSPFLDLNKVHAGWKSCLQTNTELLRSLYDRVKPFSNILRSLSRPPPTDIKVVILGHEPVKENSLVSGFAFSFPEGAADDICTSEEERQLIWTSRTYNQLTGASLVRLHDVLVDAGYLQRDGRYSCCHEDWADRGVLLLNASLEYRNFGDWQQFTKQLLLQVAELNTSQPLFFLCWGDNAAVVGSWLYNTLARCGRSVKKVTYILHLVEHSEESPNGPIQIIIYIGDHPTWPRDDPYFKHQATGQFKAIKGYYPDLFNLPLVQQQQQQ